MTRALIISAFFLLCLGRALAGTPQFVAGTAYFDPSAKGRPITWPQGQLSYYTDPGDLSPLLPHAAADTFVADSFSRWTSISTTAISTTLAGQLSEDVNGSNVSVDGSGVITLPADIAPSATDKPLAIVYDADGAVTDAFLGAGAGLSINCFTNAAFGGIDNFTTDGYFSHALVVVNGNCAQSTSDLPELQYRLVRTLGRVLGLGWSQLNLNVITGRPQAPTVADRAAFPVMHFMDSISCVPITRCYTTPDQPKQDDRAALSRLYPVTPQNATAPGKVVFADMTARVYGSVYFADSSGGPTEPMQGVNVVARWVDPATNQPSRQYAASSVSGFLFRGNAGNDITGTLDATGQPFARFGSDDTSVQGFFDLAGLEIPNGGSSATFELTVEAIDPLWSQGVGPYALWQVQPSGTAQPIRVFVSLGGAVRQDIVMLGSASELADPREPETFDNPALVPATGEWIGSLSGYGDADYFSFPGQLNRTLSVEVTALDDAGVPTQDKARPVIGMWSLSSPQGSVPGAATPTAFTSTVLGLNRLDVNLLQTGDFRIGIADERGDGRPDYRYQARVLYGDSVLPARIPAARTSPVAINGMGFRQETNVNVGSTPAGIASVSSNQLLIQAPALPDGLQSLTLADSVTGGSSSLTDVLTVGAGPNDLLLLVQGSNPPTPAGTQALNPFRVRVVGLDGVTPVSGASVAMTVVPSAKLAACAGAASCTLLSDETGEVSSYITPPAAGVFSMTATLAPASYVNPQRVFGTLSATSSSLDIAFTNSYRWVAQGASFDMPLTVRVVNNGSPLAGRTVDFSIMAGSATLVISSVITDAQGFATTSLQLRNHSATVQIAACVSTSSCATAYVNAVPLANIRLAAVAGSAQMIFGGQSFQPVVVRAMDTTVPANPVEAASISFTSTVLRPDYDVLTETRGETSGGTTAMPVILASSQATALSDINGLASILPSTLPITGPAEVEVVADSGAGSSVLFELESLADITAPATAQPIVSIDALVAPRDTAQHLENRPLARRLRRNKPMIY